MRHLGLAGIFFAVLGAMDSVVAQTQDVAAVTRPGANIQRAMRLLEESTPLKRNTVRVLFYGQSITCQEWWKAVAAELKTRYPHANLLIENRAIGGFSAQALVEVAEYDLYPNYPDLLIFHDYGCCGDGKYEAMIRRTRERTTAEILLITHHDIGRESDYEESRRIREIAVRQHCGLVDMERLWQELLKREKLEPKALLSRGPHLNEKGNGFYADFVKAFLRRDPAVANEARQGVVTDISLRGDAVVKRLPDGALEIPFTGNRIDALPGAYDYTVTDEPVADVWVDGRRPSDFPEAYACTRPSAAPFVWWPAFRVLRHNAPLVAEDWTLSVLESQPDGKKLRFRVTGSLTGEDGEGTSEATFVSKSGRVVIEGGQAWTVAGALAYRKKEMPAGFKVAWRVVPHFRDVIAFPDSKFDDTDNAVTLIEGISNGPHVLRLVPRPGVSLKLRGLRVYRPPLTAESLKGKL